MLLCLFLVSAISNVQQRWLPLEPNLVQLQGKILKVMKYGPPNYGENPESDAHYEIPIILLSKPIRVKGDPGSVVNREDLVNVSFVQLVFQSTPAVAYWHYANQDVVVTGTLFRAETGHHHTTLLMTVKTIRAMKKGE